MNERPSEQLVMDIKITIIYTNNEWKKINKLSLMTKKLSVCRNGKEYVNTKLNEYGKKMIKLEI